MAGELGASRHHLGDRNTLALSVSMQRSGSATIGRTRLKSAQSGNSPSRYSSNDVVADLGVQGVAKAEEGDEDVARLGDSVLARADTSARSGSSGRRREGERLADREVGKVVVVLREKEGQHLSVIQWQA